MEVFQTNDLVFLHKKNTKNPSSFREVFDNLAVVTQVHKGGKNQLITSSRLYRNVKDYRSSKYIKSINHPLIKRIFNLNKYLQNFLHSDMKVMVDDSHKIFTISLVREHDIYMHLISNIDLFKDVKTFMLKEVYMPYYADELLPLPNPNDILKGIINDKS